MVIDQEPDEEYLTHPEVAAILDLKAAVIQAFADHDKSLRAEVVKVNRRIVWLIGLLALPWVLNLAILFLNRF